MKFPETVPGKMFRINGRDAVLCVGLALAALAAYANHFQNDFHFDDSHTIVPNIYIRNWHNIPRFFLDTSLFSIQPKAQTYRPVVSASLAIDYWLGHGLKLFYFHLSTFLWFVVQLILMFFLFRRIMDVADPHPSNTWTALLAAACYGLHPANAETVNYIIQRGDVYSTLGVVASVGWFAAYPEQRKRGWYLAPAVAGFLSKAPALIYPFILLAYVFLIEQDGALGNWAGNGKKWRGALMAAVPAFVVTGAGAILTAAMTPSAYEPGAVSATLYRLTQPVVAWHYFWTFFLPIDLNPDSNRGYVSSPFGADALAGYLFAAVLVAVVVVASWRRHTKPISFGIAWFILALLPTSLLPLADVTNDHRMFFPFVGLALAVFWSLRLLLFRLTARLTANPMWVRGSVAAAALVLVVSAAGTRERNQVWRTEETLWHDVIVKSPDNARGLVSYATVFLRRGQYSVGLPYLERAETLTSGYDTLEINLGVAYENLGRHAEAEEHLKRAVMVSPDSPDAHLFYGRWLRLKGRLTEAQEQLETAVRLNPRYFPARETLLSVYSEQRNWPALDALIDGTLQLSYDNAAARRFEAERANRQKSLDAKAEPAAARPSPAANPTPEAMLRQAGESCKAGKYQDCLDASQKAIQLRPNYPEAYNNMAAALIALHRGDDGIQALRQALRIKPDYEVAKRNLAWALEQKRKAESGGR